MTLTLDAPGGAPVALISLPYTDLFLSPPLPSAGTYAITVALINAYHADTYGLTLESVSGSFNGETNWLPNPVCGGLSEPLAPGGIGGTRVLRCGETFPSNDLVGAGPGASDSFTFHASAGDVVHLNNSGGDYRMFLFDPTGEPVAFLTAPFCPGDGDSPPCTTTPLPLSGIYTLAVVAEDGAYRITLEALGGSFNGASNGPPTPICGLPPDGARNLCTPLPPRNGQIVGGESDAWTFLGSAGDPVTFSVTNPTPLPGLARGTLFGPDGAPVTGGTLPLSGVYTLLVDVVEDENDFSALVPYAVSIDAATCQNACADGRDNDGDGQIDMADVLGCLSRDDLSEKRECEDGLDNDGDGGIDGGTRTQPGDSACFSPNFFTEDPVCSDGADNDGDGLVDFDGLAGATSLDPQCNTNPSWLSEQVTGPATGCGVGPELALLLPALVALRSRKRR